jgi:tol-pal system protein YbgF
MTKTVPGLPLKIRLRRPGLAALPLTLAGLLFVAAVAPAAAQSVDDQLQRLQRELSDLQRQVYGGEAPAAAASSGGGIAPTQAARIQVRLDDFEAQLRQLTGRVEDINFRMQTVTDRLDKLVADVDLRLRNLEQGGMAPMAGAEGQAGQMQNDSMAAAPAAQSGAQPAPSSAPGTIGTLNQSDLDAFQRGQDTQTSGQAAPAAPAQTASTPPAAAALPDGSPQEQYDFAFGLLRQANYAGAEQAFSAFLAQHPNHGLSGNAKYWLGETYYVRGNYQQAAVTFAEGFEAYPDNSKAPDNLLKLGMSLASLGSTQDACGTFDVLLERYADAPATILSRAQRESQRLQCP